MLSGIEETPNIVKTPEGAAVDHDGILTPLDADSYVSMNMWGLTPEFIGMLEKGFTEFFQQGGDMTKREYLLPIFIGELLQQHAVTVRVLQTNDRWFGVTYREDKPVVVESFRKLIADGVYRKAVFEDLL